MWREELGVKVERGSEKEGIGRRRRRERGRVDERRQRGKEREK